MILVGLTAWLSLFMVMANFRANRITTLIILFKGTLISLALRFYSTSTILFYFWFEVSLIPIFLLILGWGYQPERFLAGLVIVFYTLISSFPLLMALIFIGGTSFSISLAGNLKEMACLPPLWLAVSIIVAFLVKFPIYIVHLWLPKAHVEAPVSGSMILAGVLLKLGGYGLYRLAPLFLLNIFNQAMIVLSGVGGVILGLLCCRTIDMKVLIAYSSVVHMALIILRLLTLESSGLAGVWWVILSHGLVSSGLFACANIIYEQRHSRRVILNKGYLSYRPFVSMAWFSLLIINFGGPFTLNLYGEINLIFAVIASAKLFSILVFLIAFFSAAYSLTLYASTQQGLKGAAARIVFSSSGREIALIWGHLWPVGLALLRLEIYLENIL